MSGEGQVGVDSSIVFDIFPEDNFSYTVKKFQPLDNGFTSNGPSFVVEARASGVFNSTDAQKWLEDFESRTRTQWRVRNTFNSTPKILWKKGYRCHHNTLPRGAKCHEKNTNCPSSLTLTLYRSNNGIGSSDFNLDGYQLNIYLKSCHNHLIHASDASRHLRPTSDVTDKFTSMFKKGHSPSSALSTHKFDLQMEHGDNYYKAEADGSKCPSLGWCYRLFYKHFLNQYGEASGPEMVESLKKLVKDYNSKCNDECAKVFYQHSDSNSEFSVAICSPFMKRVHEQLRASGEIVFVDSSGTMDRHNTRIFLFLAPSVAGALPLGIVFTFSESEVSLNNAFNLLKSVLPENAFYGKGKNGPNIFMTDNSTPLRSALNSVFPNALLLLCVFHTLQAMWRYLWDSHHKVVKDDRPFIMNLFKELVYCHDKDTFTDKYEDLINNDVMTKYSDVKKYISGLQTTATDWAICYRLHLLTRGHDTNNYAEAGFRVLKDKIFQRLKAYNVPQTFDFMTTRFDLHIEQKIVTVLNNRAITTGSRYFIDVDKTKNLEATAIGPQTYKVTNHDKLTEYTVYTDIDRCTCFVGETGAPCKHQYIVALNFRKSSSQFMPLADSESKIKLHFMLYNAPPPNNWYSTLRGEETIAESPQSCPPPSVSSDPEPDHVLSVDSDISNSNEIELPCNETEAAYKDFLKIAEILREKMDSKKDVYLPAVQSFVQNFNNQSSESSLVSALHSFGKHDPLTPRRRATIPVNSSSIARRSVYAGGRKVQFTGRPSNDLNLTPSQKRSTSPTWAKPPAKRQAHSLSQSVSQNKSMAKNHTKK